MIILCALAGYFVYIVQNLPDGSPPLGTPLSTRTFDSVQPATPTSLANFQPTEITIPTALPIIEETLLLTPIPSPLPGSYDGTPPTGKIAFACYIKQIDQICLMNADGTQRIQLTDFSATAFYSSVSPDGTTVYFSSRHSGGYEIYSISVDGGSTEKLTNNIGSLYAPELSPNGEWIIFTNHGNGLWLMRPDGKNPHPLTGRDDIDPTWSADGSMIAFASSRAGARQLFVMNADGTNIRQVTNLDNMGGRSSFSPDGTKLAFYRGPTGDHNIYIINIDGTGLVQLTNGGDNLGPSWSPDGNWIAFTSFRDGNNEIYITHPDGTGLTRLTNSPISDWQPRWGR
ncbi:MAG TPA: DPP IV N-terminal domain-containing protein [Anaerolineales bacterium]|nr:DPP IV N-terminal domain-containing protein [Anaerolineales bacterium]